MKLPISMPMHPIRRAKKIYNAVSSEESSRNKLMTKQGQTAKEYDKQYPPRWQETVSLGFYHPGRPTVQQWDKQRNQVPHIRDASHHMHDIAGAPHPSATHSAKRVRPIPAKTKGRTRGD